MAGTRSRARTEVYEGGRRLRRARRRSRCGRPAGTCWARHAWADDPERSVVNEWGRSHDVKNLFIVDGSVFVTSGGVNPTLDHPGGRPVRRRHDEAAPRQSVRLSEPMTQDQTPEGSLSEQERHALQAVAGSMIPPGPAFGVPGADDATIFADILSVAEREAYIVRRALRRLDEAGGAPFRRARCSPPGRGSREVSRTLAGPVHAAGRGDPALLLPRRSGNEVSGHGAPGAVPERLRRSTGRLVAARPRTGARQDLPGRALSQASGSGPRGLWARRSGGSSHDQPLRLQDPRENPWLPSTQEGRSARRWRPRPSAGREAATRSGAAGAFGDRHVVDAHDGHIVGHAHAFGVQGLERP